MRSTIQHEIKEPSDLLDKCGELIRRGYAKKLILKYNRENAAKKNRLKEWDYYLIYNNDYAIALTVAKSSIFAMISASFIDFQKASETTKAYVALAPFGKLKMPLSSETGDIKFQNKKVKVSFEHHNDVRVLQMDLKNFSGKTDLKVYLELSEEPKDSMVIATPFTECIKDFYYNQKIIGMRASGNVEFNGEAFDFNDNNTFGLLDWGRGIWPHKVTWYWGAGQGIVNGTVFGFNLGYGFGDTFAATENMLFYNGRASKLENVTFNIPKNEKGEYEYMKPWTVTSSDNRFVMEFSPIIDRSASMSAIILSSEQHQVFGYFNGRAELDGGRTIELHDFLGFMERVQNKW